jgi:hypothetical protein
MDCATRRGWQLCFWLATPLALSLCLYGCGCRKEADPQFPDHLRGFRSPPPDPGFQLLVQAAEAAEQDAPKQIGRTTWTPGHKESAIKNASRALGLLDRAQRTGVRFEFAPTAPGTTRQSVRGWRFLGRVLKWKIEDALDAGKGGDAAAHFAKAVRLASDLSGGDGMDAGLGYAIANDCADSLWPSLPSLSAGELSGIYSRISSALANAPKPEDTLANEAATMMAAVQWVQDLYLHGDLKQIQTALGVSVEAAVKHLRKLKSQSAAEQVGYFVGFAAGATTISADLRERAALLPNLWEKPKAIEGQRPWRRLSASLLQTGYSFLDNWAAYQARMRLMALDAALLARFKRGQGVPKDLSSLPRWLRTDPFSGRDFTFIPEGPDYKLYSVGPDRTDDGGDKGTDITLGR